MAPAAMAEAVTASSARPPASRIEGAIWTITWITAPTPMPKEEGRELGVRHRRPDHRAQDRGGAGDHAEQREAADGRPLLIAHQRRDDREALGRVVDREADHERRTERQLGDRIGGADRKALPHVVEADPDRDHQREPGPADPASPSRLAGEIAIDSRQGHEGEACAEQHQLGTAERAARLAGDLESFQAGVDREESEEADRHRHDGSDPGRPEASHRRQEQHSERHGDDADVKAQERHQREQVAVGFGRLDGGGDLVIDHEPGRGEHRDQIRLAVLPGEVDRDRLGLEPADGLLGAGEVDVGVSHEHLGELHLVRPGVAKRQLDLVRLELRLLDREFLDRRPRAVGQRVVADDRDRDEHDGDQREDAAGERPEWNAPPGHSCTSKKPIQPRSANSVLWAWNMNSPGYGNFSSRMPRWPWPWMTVSVNSVGVSEVPVGK